MRASRLVLQLALFLALTANSWAQTVGSISGTVKDPTGAVLPGTTVSLRNTGTGVVQSTQTNAAGVYGFPSVAVGQYEIDFAQSGFKPYKRTGLTIDVNTKLQADIDLELGEANQQVTVSEAVAQVETQSTQMGDVIPGKEIISVGLNGRSYTDLLALQPGIAPMTTQTGDSVVMAGVVTAIQPSGGLDAGNQSISGQREDANGFLINGSDTKEEMNGGTGVIPNLDSIAEFRVLTNNFDAEFGNYNGGIVNVATKSGTNQFHGDAFEFLRNTALDARNYTSPQKEAYDQNQFGGTIGGPIIKNKLFFFGDYQGTRTTQGIDTGSIAVPSLADRTGDLSDIANQPGIFSNSSGPLTIQGAAMAAQLQNSLGYAVTPGENYYTAGCTSSGPSPCVFPNAFIPPAAWSAPARNLLQYIPKPNLGSSTFAAQANETLRDDKLGFRVDENSSRWGNFSAYYFFDDYYVNNPFPSGQGGATIPGFNGINHGRSQLISLGDAKTFGTTLVNEFHFSIMRDNNTVGAPSGGLGPSYASQGFATGPHSAGIYPLDPANTGIENIVLQGDFVMGLPITNVAQANNTFSLNDSISKVLGNHTIKAGIEASLELVNVNPDAIFNGTTIFNGYQTGSDFADFLIGSPNQFNQQDSGPYYPRHKYLGWFGQDSWRARPTLVFNYGLRVDLMQFWSEKYNQVPTFIPGEQSHVFPQSFPGLVYVTDKGVPPTLVPERFRYAPRIGVAYSPDISGGRLGKLFGGAGKTSIRAGFGIFNTMIQGQTIGIDEPQPPFGLSGTVYNGLFATPYNLAAGGSQVNPYPLAFPKHNASVHNPYPNVVYNGKYNPQSGMTAPVRWDTYPYSENYFLSFERQLPGQTVLNLSYIGSQAHHLILVFSADPGNAALCLALDQPGVLAPGNQCGPGGENTTYNLLQNFTFGGITYPVGTALQGTRGGLDTSFVNNAAPGNYFGNDDYEGTVGNSSYNALQASIRASSGGLTYSLGYTWSKSIDEASSISDAIDPFNFKLTRGLSAWDQRHNFVATYDYRLPLEQLAPHARHVLEGWEISGITRLGTGFPVTLSTNGDNSLQGSSPNGVNNRYLDLPDLTGVPIGINHNPKGNGLEYFNPAAFTDNAIGTVGDAGRRIFSGPGLFNTDGTLQRNFSITESKTVQIRLETFNVFNHTQFFGPAAVDGDVDTPLFGHVVKALPPRLMQLAVKYTF